MTRGLQPRRNLGRWLTAGIVATLIAVVGRPGTAHADLCVGIEEGFGNCFTTAIVHQGEFPFGITVSNTEQAVIVVDYLSGLFYKYDRSSVLSAGSAQAFNCPFGPATYTGIAASADTLFWIVDTGSGQMLAHTPLDGTAVQFMAPISAPSGGIIGDIAFNSITGMLWGVDINNDEYFSFTTMGVLSGNPPIPSPGLELAGEAFGTGLTFAQAGGTTVLDVPVGNPVDLRAARVERLTPAGNLTGFRYDLDPATNNLTWVTGIAWAADESGPTANFPVHYVVDGVDNRITEVPLVAPSASGVIGLTVTADVFNNVLLSWTNTETYTSIEIRRDGTVIDTLSGTAVEYADTVEDGLYTYTVSVQDAGSTTFESPISRSVVVGRGRLLGSTVIGGGNADALAITVVESLDQVFVVDLSSGTTYRYNKDLTSAGTISSPFGMATTPAIAWDSDNDLLYWLNGDTNDLATTNNTGGNVTTVGTLVSPAGGLIGDITYAGGGLFWGVDITQNVYFQFDATGAATGVSFSFPAGGGLGNGIAAVGTSGQFEIPAGVSEGDLVTRIARVDETGSLSNSTPILASTRSGFVNGVAWTTSGSEGEEAAYLVGNDTRALFEISLFTFGAPFSRGDANDDGAVDLIDATYTLFYLFASGPTPTCLDAADANDDGTVNVNDASYILGYLFAGSPAPPAPFGACDVDATDDAFSCEEYTSCP